MKNLNFLKTIMAVSAFFLSVSFGYSQQTSDGNASTSEVLESYFGQGVTSTKLNRSASSEYVIDFSSNQESFNQFSNNLRAAQIGRDIVFKQFENMYVDYNNMQLVFILSEKSKNFNDQNIVNFLKKHIK